MPRPPHSKDESVATLPDEFIHKLTKAVSGGVRTDLTTKILYSTDASLYQIEPLGVAFPRDEDELCAAVEIAARFRVPVLPRGSGSSIAGQAIGPAMILDCSRYLNSILEINHEEGTALVQPGVILNSLNRAATRYGLQFGPDPASAERATMGGSLANNASGAHSIIYGMAADHLLSAEVVLADGSLATFSEVSLKQAHNLAQLPVDVPIGADIPPAKSLEEAIYRAAILIRQGYGSAIRQHWPVTWRRASGYSINYLLPYSPTHPPLWDLWERTPGGRNGRGENPVGYPPLSANHINLAPLLAGSEGTLAIIRRAKLRMVALPRHTVLGVLAYSSLIEACDAAPGLLAVEPSAIELIPQSLILLARSVPAYAAQLSFIDKLLINGEVPAALLVVEFSGDDPAALRQQAERLGQGVFVADTQAVQRQVWGVRKVAMGLLSSRPGDLKSTAFIEDLAVPVEHLGEFVREMERILSSHATTGEFAAHASAGCLHIRPMLNLKIPGDVQKLREIAFEAVELTLRLGGSVSGEHGDGLARSQWLEKMYGEEIIAAFRLLKSSADPDHLLNPGKILDPQALDANLRTEKMQSARTWIPFMDFSRQAGIAGAIELCNGAGVCRKTDGVMCPSFQATREEMHSTRGRANLLRAWMYPPDDAQFLREITDAVHSSLDLCLACKGCKAECPSAVDIARLKYEFMYDYHQKHPHKLRDYLFAFIGEVARLGYRFAPLLNPILTAMRFRKLLDRTMHISKARALPTFSARAMQSLVKQKDVPSHADQAKVLFLSDPFTEYYYPQNGVAAVEALRRSGMEPIFISVLGAGRTYLSKGFLKEARQHAIKLVDEIQRLDPEQKLPIVGVEPSEIYTLSDEYLDLLSEDSRIPSIAGRAWMIDEFLIRPTEKGVNRLSWFENCTDRQGAIVYLHGHCYQKARPPHPDGYPTGVAASVALLKQAGYDVRTIDSGCCGMAGAFGYEAEHYDLSMQIGEQTLFPAIRAAVHPGNEDIMIAAAGVSCHSQIMDGTQQNAIHPIVLFTRCWTE